MTKRTIFPLALLSLVISASLAFTAASAAEKGIIIDESIHDYSDDASRSLPTSSSQQGWSGFNVKIVLDKAYHDYSDLDVVAFESTDSDLKRAEFAAFEEYSSGVSSENNYSDIPWVSEVY